MNNVNNEEIEGKIKRIICIYWHGNLKNCPQCPPKSVKLCDKRTKKIIQTVCQHNGKEISKYLWLHLLSKSQTRL